MTLRSFLLILSALFCALVLAEFTLMGLAAMIQRADSRSFMAYVVEREKAAAACATAIPPGSLNTGYSSLSPIFWCRSEYDKWRNAK